MKLKKFGVWALAITLGLSSCTKEETESIATLNENSDNLVTATSENGQIIEGEYIVVLNSNVLNKNAVKGVSNYQEQTTILKKELAKQFSNKAVSVDKIAHVYRNTVDGFSVKLNKDEIETLKNDSRVKLVEPNRVVILKRPVPAPEPEPTGGQEVPWGIARVNGGVDGSGLTAWVIDSGIDGDHPDLNVDAARSADFTGSRKGWDDENGHGTHVAGTIGAINNDFGVVGVAAGCKVVAVRVLDRRGSGSYDGVMAGVDYVAANGSNGDVANMSLGGPVSEALDLAVYNASLSGVKFVLAAGNESDDANNHSPARVNGTNIYTISASDINDGWAYFSNYGNPPVDFCAPGYNIYSTAKGGGYETMSGTSMASPHAAGVLLLGNAGNGGTVNGDPDGNPDVIIVH